MDQFLLCVQDCDVSINLQPTYMKAYIRKIKALLYLERTKDAIDMAEQAIKIDSENEEVHLLLADAQQNILDDSKFRLSKADDYMNKILF